ncbi:uncharacterized protein LOC134167382 [Pezoporus occidentalis]|uniref:uncharacterized protein LOC134167382 n=1 Tax=Pezoporus occidentalis TaxID=407982 RepID=UPI002F91551E
METVGPFRSHRELRPARIWQRLSTMPASSLLASAPREHEALSPSWRLLVSRLVVIPHQALDRAMPLKPMRESAPWGKGARRVSVLDPVFLAQQRVSLARLKDQKAEQIKVLEASRARFLPVVKRMPQDELKQPRGAARPSMQLPEYALQPSGTEMSSLHAERADQQLQLLMGFKRREVEAEVWRKYHASRTGQSMEAGKSPCRYVFEDPYCPPHLLRKAYDEKLKERLLEKEVLQEERCQSAARQTASKGQAELHLLGRAWGGKQEKRRLLERQWKAQGLPAIPRSCELPCCTAEEPAAGTLVITAFNTVSRRPSRKGECAK